MACWPNAWITPPALKNHPRGLTVEAVHRGELADLLLGAVVEDVYAEPPGRVVQRPHVLPGVVEQVRRLAADGEEDVHGRVVALALGPPDTRGVVLGVEVLPPDGHAEV